MNDNIDNHTDDDNQAMLLVSDVAKLVDRVPATIRNWADAGRLPCTRTKSGTRLFQLSDVLALAE